LTFQRNWTSAAKQESYVKCGDLTPGLCRRGMFRKKVFLLVIILILLFLGKFILELHIGAKRDLLSIPLREVVSILSEESTEQASFVAAAVEFGFKEVASDILFLQTIQYFGDWNLKREEKLKKVFPLFQAMSFISPHFVPAYSFGALVLQELGHVNEAIDLLNRGVAKNPRAFELWLYRDFTIRLFRTKEYKKAIEGIKTALKIEGYPPILERILAYAYEKDGQIEKAIWQWQKIYDSTDDLKIKEICMRHIKRLTGEE